MLEFVQYTTSGFWVFIGSYAIIALVLYFVINGILSFFNRLWRMVMVTTRGWPPAHLDADGDWKSKQTNEQALNAYHRKQAKKAEILNVQPIEKPLCGVGEKNRN